MMLCRFGQLRNSFVFTRSTHSATLQQAVLQVYTKPFLNFLLETGDRAVEIKNGLGTFIV